MKRQTEKSFVTTPPIKIQDFPPVIESKYIPSSLFPLQHEQHFITLRVQFNTIFHPARHFTFKTISY